MSYNLKRVSAILLVTAFVYSGSALAAYGPAPAPKVKRSSSWTLSAGYGQTFGHKKAQVSEAQLQERIYQPQYLNQPIREKWHGV